MNRSNHPLAQWLALTNLARERAVEPVWSQSLLARKLRTHQSNVSCWFAGTRKMPLRCALAVARLTKGAVTMRKIVAWERAREGR